MRDVASFLRMMRKQVGLTQIEAADGIMDKDSLSLVERGRRTPHPEHFMMLLERYGLVGYSLGDFLDMKNARLLDLKNKILSAMNDKELEQLPELLSYFRNECENGCAKRDATHRFGMQFFDYVKAWWMYAMTEDAGAFLEACERCFRMTQPKGAPFDVPQKGFLIQTEMMILNTAARLYAARREYERALGMFEGLLIHQKGATAAHPIYHRNVACLCHNAALLEWRSDPLLAERHIKEALERIGRNGGAWMGCQVWRSQLQLARVIRPERDLTRELWELEGCYRKFCPKGYRGTDFSTFLSMREYLDLL